MIHFIEFALVLMAVAIASPHTLNRPDFALAVAADQARRSHHVPEPDWADTIHEIKGELKDDDNLYELVSAEQVQDWLDSGIYAIPEWVRKR